MGKVVGSWEQLKTELDRVRSGRKVVFTNGCFDILHVGHIRYLQEARALGDVLVVALNTDQSVRKLKGPQRPVQSESDRAEIMAALGCVDFVTLFGEETPDNIIRAVRPDILVKGGDYTIATTVGAPFVMSYGGEVKILQFVAGKSTTKVLEKAHT